MLKSYIYLKKYNLVVLIFLGMLAGTFLTAHLFQQTQNKNHRIQHANTLNAVTTIVKEVATDMFHPMASLAANLSANHAFKAKNQTEQFHRFIKSKDLLDRYPNVFTWAYAARIPNKDLSESLRKIDNEPGRAAYDYAPIEVFPSNAGLDSVTPIVIAEPLRVRQQTLGYNLLSSKPRRNAALQALKRGVIQATERLELKVNAAGILLLQPVYSTETTPKTYEERLEKHIGFVLTANTTESLSDSVAYRFEALGLDVDIHDYGPIGITDGPELNYSTLLSSSRWDDQNSHQHIRHPLLNLSDANVDQMSIEVAGRIWRVVVRDNSSGFRQHDYFTLIIIISGILLSLLTTALVFQQQHSARLLLKRVDTRTKALKEAHGELSKSRDRAKAQALTDPLTGLGNRRFLVKKFQQVKSDTKLEEPDIAMILFDIDFFKSINDSRGHDFGDKILSSFADRIRIELSEYIYSARLGGDEFAFLMSSSTGKYKATTVAKHLLKIIQEVGAALDIPSLTGSAGVAKFMAKDSNLSDIMKHADIALYEAKQDGRNRFVSYTKAMGERVTKKTEVLAAVTDGLEKDAFVPVFHPFVNLKNGQITGFEILARWKHETRGLLAPGAFWDALEDDAFATRISLMVMEKALRQAGDLVKRGFDVGHLGINATEQMLKDKHFVDNLLGLAEECGLSSHNLKIEVTERILLSRETKDMMTTLERLAAEGVSIAFDDFGTGFASLIHLRTFPINCVKIDRSFVQEIATDPKSRTIISSICQMAHELGYTVIAEGIETEECAAIIKDLECDTGQGFLYGKPMDIKAAEKLLVRNLKQAA